MAPKKDEAAAGKERVFLGRVRANLAMGVVGLPNVGKSSFFNILCDMSVPAENFPFCTVDPSTSRVIVQDERFDWLVSTFKPASVVPAVLKVTDIAGLVKGAHEGQGLGNAFLSHIRAVDGIFYMSRAFEDEEIVHVEGNVDPVRDLEIIQSELVLKDLDALQKYIEPLRKIAVSTQKEKKKELEAEFIAAQLFLTAKPVVYLVNLSEEDYIRKKNRWLAKIKQWIDQHDPGAALIPFSVPFEQKLRQMPADERAAFLEANKTASQLTKIVRTGYQVLHLVYFFTAGEDEVRAWTIHEGTKAPQAAGTIHTDFERGFVCADVIKYADMHELGNEAACKAAGKMILGGKNYVVEDGDIMHIKANTVGLDKKK